MIGSIRTIAMAAGAVGVAGIATYVGMTAPSSDVPVEVIAASDDGFEICLENKIAFFEGVETGCYSRTEVAAWRDLEVVDRSDEAVMVMMTHPSDYSVNVEQCTTCRSFVELRWQGWFAMSSRDIRREAYFVRACGVLDMLMKAQPASENYFEDGAVSPSDMAAIGAERILRVGDDPATKAGDLVVEEYSGEAGARTDSQAVEQENAQELGWRLSTAGQETRLERIATADFDGDGIAEILTFLVAGPDDATASVSTVALLEKDGADVAAVLTPQSFAPESQGTGGAR